LLEQGEAVVEDLEHQEQFLVFRRHSTHCRRAGQHAGSKFVALKVGRRRTAATLAAIKASA
jgi:hypothetical protein